MKLHEYQAREILGGYGIVFPPGRVAVTPDEAEAITRDLGGKVVVKAQILAGGRGKAGGIKLAASPAEAREYAALLLGSSIKQSTVRQVLTVQAVTITKEFYLGTVLDRPKRAITLVASGVGGVDIEEVASSSPESVVKVTADPMLGLADYQARELAFGVGCTKQQAASFASIACALYKAFVEQDCSLVEINPLALTDAGDFAALDSKMVIDDNAAWRQPTLFAMRDLSEEDRAETQARELGLSYIKLGGNVGCLVNGAGLAMATMDAIKLHGGEPANFLDIGGGASVESVVAALKIVLMDPGVKSVLINIFGGITRCDTVAQGLVDFLQETRSDLPVVARLTGTNEAEGRRILNAARIEMTETMSAAAAKAVRLAQGSKVVTG
jgi:succinyl-CoA synthetase beta subunit